jgi:general stress protein YciG
MATKPPAIDYASLPRFFDSSSTNTEDRLAAVSFSLTHRYSAPRKRDFENLSGPFYEQIGKKGGESVRASRGPEFYSQIGHKGGQKVRELIEQGKRVAKEATLKTEKAVLTRWAT